MPEKRTIVLTWSVVHKQKSLSIRIRKGQQTYKRGIRDQSLAREGAKRASTSGRRGTGGKEGQGTRGAKRDRVICSKRVLRSGKKKKKSPKSIPWPESK